MPRISKAAKQRVPALNVLDPIEPQRNLGFTVSLQQEQRCLSTLQNGLQRLLHAIQSAAHTDEAEVTQHPVLQEIFHPSVLLAHASRQSAKLDRTVLITSPSSSTIRELQLQSDQVSAVPVRAHSPAISSHSLDSSQAARPAAATSAARLNALNGVPEEQPAPSAPHSIHI